MATSNEYLKSLADGDRQPESPARSGFQPSADVL